MGMLPPGALREHAESSIRLALAILSGRKTVVTDEKEIVILGQRAVGATPDQLREYAENTLAVWILSGPPR